MKRTVIDSNVAAEKRGQLFAFILGLTAIAGGIWLISSGKDAQGLISIIVAFTALAGTFIYGRWQQQQERARKRREAKEAAENPRLPLESN